MTRTLKGLIIRPSFAYQDAPDDGFISAVNNVEKGLDGNPVLNTPPVPIASLRASKEALELAMPAAKDGGKKAVLDKNKKRQDTTIMMRLLAHYVEIACNGDMKVFLSSGFEPAVKTPKKPPEPLPVPTFHVDYGTTLGQLLVGVDFVPKAMHYQVEGQQVVTPPAPEAPTTTFMVNSVKKPVEFNNLTPGATYSFKVRAYGKLGYTEWSPSIQKMCT